MDRVGLERESTKAIIHQAIQRQYTDITMREETHQMVEQVFHEAECFRKLTELSKQENENIKDVQHLLDYILYINS